MGLLASGGRRVGWVTGKFPDTLRRFVDNACDLQRGGTRCAEMIGKRGPPVNLLRARLQQILCRIRSERLLLEQMDYNLFFRRFVGLNVDDPIWDPTVFPKNRDRFLEGDMARAFFDRILA